MSENKFWNWIHNNRPDGPYNPSKSEAAEEDYREAQIKYKQAYDAHQHACAVKYVACSNLLEAEKALDEADRYRLQKMKIYYEAMEIKDE